MEVLLGTPPPPPPPNVPTLEESTEDAGPAARLTTAERLRMHRANLALDNFGVTGRWRIREDGVALDTRGEFYDGTEIHDPASLVDVLVKRPIPFVRHFTQTLMTYALGRRVDYRDQPTVRAIAGAAAERDYRVSAFVKGVVTSDAFRMKRASPTQDDLQ